MRKRQIFFLFFICILLLPLWMWLAWWLTPKRKLVTAIIDKSTLTSKGQEHLSLNWVLNASHFTKTSTERYDPAKDYFGFHPLKNEKFKLTGLERFTNEQLEQLSIDCDLTYYTDTYGVYVNEWYRKTNEGERSGLVYGGMTQEDITYLQKMKAKNKLIICEFNTIGSPTTPDIRGQFEKLFGIKWSGWTCRYFNSFDTIANKDLPRWLVRNYKLQHNNHWPFKKGGIAFVKNRDDIVILEDEVDLNYPVPMIKTTAGKALQTVTEEIRYPYWIDIVIPDTTANIVLAEFHIDVTVKGAKTLNTYGLPATIPAVTRSHLPGYQFYYLSGDFCDNEVDFSSSYYQGISFFKGLLYSDDDLLERESFFWNFYKPMMTDILENYYRGRKRNKAANK